MGNIFSRKNIFSGFLLVVFIIIFEIILARLELPAWPAFMVMIFFFVVHENSSLAPNIIIGGLAGIACVIISKEFIHLLGPAIGTEAAKLTFIGLFVFSIVLLKDAIPYVFNSYAFMFFLVSAIAAKETVQSPFVWMGVELVVGSVFIAGILGINRIVNTVIKCDVG